MTNGRKLVQLVDPSSGLRPAKRWRLLLAHDATASTCDALVEAISGGLGNVDLSRSSSVDDAEVAIYTGRFDAALVCLDLHPAPSAGVKLAQEMVRLGLPTVIVTRSLRWIPAAATTLRDVPWLTPDASPTDVAVAVSEAVAQSGGWNAIDEGVPSSRGSWWTGDGTAERAAPPESSRTSETAPPPEDEDEEAPLQRVSSY